MAIEQLVRVPSAPERERARLLDGIRGAENRLDAGAVAVQNLFNGLAKHMPPIHTMNNDGLVRYNSYGGPIHYYSATWNTHSGEVTVLSANPHQPLDDEGLKRTTIESAASLTGSILLRLLDSVREYRDPEKVAEALSAFKKLKDMHVLARQIAVTALGINVNKGDPPETAIEKRAWGFEGTNRTNRIKAALLWHQKRRAATAAITSATALSSEADMSPIQNALARLAQRLDGDRIFPRRFSDFTTGDGSDWIIVERDSARGDVIIATDGKMGRWDRTAKKMIPLSNAELLLKAGPAAGRLLSRCIESILPNLGHPEPSKA